MYDLTPSVGTSICRVSIRNSAHSRVPDNYLPLIVNYSDHTLCHLRAIGGNECNECDQCNMMINKVLSWIWAECNVLMMYAVKVFFIILIDTLQLG